MFECDHCGRCCETHRVPVTREDVRRLMRGGHEPHDFLELLSPHELDLTGEPETLLQLPGGPRLPVLAHGARGCVFLEPAPGGGRQCSVHSRRPLSCRAYPFDRGEHPRTAVGLHPDALCPPETGTLRVLQDQRPLTHYYSVEARDRDLRQHTDFVTAWNRAQRLRRALGKRRKTTRDLLRALAADETGGAAEVR